MDFGVSKEIEEKIREHERMEIAARMCSGCRDEGKPAQTEPSVDYYKRGGGTVSTMLAHKDGFENGMQRWRGCAAGSNVWPLKEQVAQG